MADQVIKVHRPYSSVEDFIRGDGGIVDRKTMLLPGVGPLEPDSVIRFDIILENGDRIIRAEGVVKENVAPKRGKSPGGVRVGFKRLDGKSKEILRQVVEANEASASRPKDRPMRPPMASIPEGSMDAEPTSSSRRPVEIIPADAPAPAAQAAPPSPSPVPPADSEPRATAAAESPPSPARTPERSAIRAVPRDPVDPPANREELLAKLRDRARKTS